MHDHEQAERWLHASYILLQRDYPDEAQRTDLVRNDEGNYEDVSPDVVRQFMLVEVHEGCIEGIEFYDSVAAALRTVGPTTDQLWLYDLSLLTVARIEATTACRCGNHYYDDVKWSLAFSLHSSWEPAPHPLFPYESRQYVRLCEECEKVGYLCGTANTQYLMVEVQ